MLNPKQFCTIEEANRLIETFGPLGLGAVAEVPHYLPGDVEAPSYDETHKMYLLHFGNGFVNSAGLLLDKIAVLGSKARAWDSLKAEMEGAYPKLIVAWWAQRPVD